MPELDKQYNPVQSEAARYKIWEDKGYFRPRSDKEGKKPGRPYVIVIPPPNVTGILHMGHALNNTIQDILTRWNRMRGIDTLWIPGVDHAGIATQNVVEKKLAKEKKKRQDLGREKFLEEVWRWKEEHGSTITRQLRSLGASCDWSRERFTMDDGLSLAVRECFVRLYKKGLIYQGHYIINWCPRCQTALSDEEAEHKDTKGFLYHIKYAVAGMGSKCERPGEDHVIVATTRPETLLGDLAVAINPDDPRYQHLKGKKVILPLMNREIPVIQDAFVDPAFGTGVVKVTPAHDPNDFEMGKRHNLPQLNVMHPDGTMNVQAGPYVGLDRFEARKKIVEDLEAQGLFDKKEPHGHAVGHCYRCHTVVEPFLSKQWFVKMKPLADRALEAHRQGKTTFYPDRWTKVYTNWLEGIRDWCISRQIWWGHQIPVWYDDEKNIYVALSEEEARAQAKARHGKDVELTQDPDVLDTWFSSWLWPFSTLGWPEKTEDLKHFYPTADLTTASEIIFFWVSRMVMAGLEFMDEVPFSRIYIHGTVRDSKGQKMSKSLGNSIDPLEVIGEMGADALRYSMIMLSSQDVYLSREKFEVGRNFTNKLWNAARFALIQLDGFTNGKSELDVDIKKLPLASRWILSAMEARSREADRHLSEFGFAQASEILYHFSWNDFCDWFIELAKPALGGESEQDKENTKRVLFHVLERVCRLLHPFAPFVTEEIWQHLRAMAADKDLWPETLMLAAWPVDGKSHYADEQAEKSLDVLRRAVSGLRDLRANMGISPAEKLLAVFLCRDDFSAGVLETSRAEVMRLARLESFEITRSFEKSKSYVGNSYPDFEAFLRVEGVVDLEKERERLQKKLQEKQSYVLALDKKLSNENFVKNAPADVVAAEREKLDEARRVMTAYQEQLALFC